MTTLIPEREGYVELMKNRALGLTPEMGSAIRMAQIVTGLAGNTDRLSLVDIGCAGGHYLQSILKRLPPSTTVHYTGVDVDAGMVAAASGAWAKRQKEFPHVTADFMQSNAETLGALGLQADIVFCSNAFMYIGRPQRALDGMLGIAQRHCVIRSYFWTQTFIVKRAWNDDELNGDGEPDSYDLWNIYSQALAEKMVTKADPRFRTRWEEDNNVEGLASMARETEAGVEKRDPTQILNGQEIVYPFFLPWKYLIASRSG